MRSKIYYSILEDFIKDEERVDWHDESLCKVFSADGIATVKAFINEHFDANKRIVTILPELDDSAEHYSAMVDPHTFNDVDLAVIKAQLAVAENGTVWLTDQLMGHRILYLPASY